MSKLSAKSFWIPCEFQNWPYVSLSFLWLPKIKLRSLALKIILQLFLIKSTYLLWRLFPAKKNLKTFMFNLQRMWDTPIILWFNPNSYDEYIFETYAILSSVSIGTSSDFASPLVVASPFSIFPTSGFSASAGKASVSTGAALGTFRGINKNSSSTSSSFARSKSS